ncbi:hypothetical protein DYU05_02665 [Mucilaginibacter terrenus]|uniref:Glycine zipper family protein n=1 Tax=Mucilaginibacter terrenus TaxID=2482727 RepID=A0A3E2NU54_9SPHI|nr:hypothetical protein [Mucilaginibacter terrenus]RFZ84538.1 hypothetical protein DYU05_02665 [Mucilaginibacter terrenus]
MKKKLLLAGALLLFFGSSCQKNSETHSSNESQKPNVSEEITKFYDYNLQQRQSSAGTTSGSLSKAEESFSSYVNGQAEKVKLFNSLVAELSGKFINPDKSVKSILKPNLVNPNPSDPPTPVTLFSDYMAQASTVPAEMQSNIPTASYSYLDNLNRSFISASETAFSTYSNQTSFTATDVSNIKRRYTNIISNTQSQVENDFSLPSDQKTAMVNSLIAIKAYINSSDFDYNFSSLINAPLAVDNVKHLSTNALQNQSLWSALASIGKAIVAVVVVVSCIAIGAAIGSQINPLYGGIIGGVSGYTVGGYLAEKWFGVSFLPGGID